MDGAEQGKVFLPFHGEYSPLLWHRKLGKHFRQRRPARLNRLVPAIGEDHPPTDCGEAKGDYRSGLSHHGPSADTA
jgi:hypothetical protein